MCDTSQVREGHTVRPPAQKLQEAERQPGTAELTVYCASLDGTSGNVHGCFQTREAHAYLNRRVSNILSQIKCSSSASHYDRHRVEIDELLRCDAPMGFTPSMVLSGIPKILHLLTEAVRTRQLQDTNVVDTQAMRALSPLRKSRRNSLVLNPFIKPTCSGNGRPNQRRSGAALGHEGPHQGIESVCGNGCPVQASSKSLDITAFLPPLVRRPERTDPAVKSQTVVTTARSVESSKLSPEVKMLSFPAASSSLKKNTWDCGLLARKRLDTSIEGAGAGETSPQATQLDSSRKQQSSTGAEETTTQRCINSAESDEYTPLLPDIPSAIEAMLFHCALPLVCLTPEDHSLRAAAVRALVSAMSSLVSITWNQNENLYQTLQAKDSDKDSEDGSSSKCSSELDSNEQLDNAEKSCIKACSRIRRTALQSLLVLLFMVSEENETDLNKHFASRDKKFYEAHGADEPQDPLLDAAVDFVLECKQLSMQDTNKDKDERTRSSSAGSLFAIKSKDREFMLNKRRSVGVCSSSSQHFDALRRLSYMTRLSVYNNTVALDMLLPLLKRWTFLLNYHVQDNDIVDSVRASILNASSFSPHNVENLKQKEARASIMIAQELGSQLHAGPASEAPVAPAAATDPPPVVVKSTVISSEDMEEICLLLRIALQLSKYKHHAMCASYIVPNVEFQCDITPCSLPVLLCLTMARCVEGDKCLPLCIESLWNLLEVIPDETMQRIFLHTRCETAFASNDHTSVVSSVYSGADRNKEDTSNSEKKSTECHSAPSPAWLTASESLLRSFIQLLLTGHRLRHREMRNDILVLMQIMLKRHTGFLIDVSKGVHRPNEASQQSLFLPHTTVKAINSMAITVFDLTCGAELQTCGRTAKLTGCPVDDLMRNHTVLSPTTRKENLQFKVLGWRMLEAFHAWQHALPTIASHHRLLQTQMGSNSAIATSTIGEGANLPNLDLCGLGFIEALLMYVDTNCNNKYVVAWSKEDLMDLQEEAWSILLTLVESAVQLRMCNNNVISASQTDCPKSETQGYRSEETIEKENEMFLLGADEIFVSKNGIKTTIRYIQETMYDGVSATTNSAFRLLSVLSRCDAHRAALLGAKEPTSPCVEEPQPVLLVIVVQVIQWCLQCVERRARLGNTASSIPPYSKSGNALNRAFSSKTNSNNYSKRSNEWSCKSEARSVHSLRDDKEKIKTKRQMEQEPHKASSCASANSHEIASTTTANDSPLHFPAQIADVLLNCLILLYNVTGGTASQQAETQNAFIAMNGVSLILKLIWNSLTPLETGKARFFVRKKNDEQLCAALNCVRVFIRGNKESQAQFVQEDGVHVLLAVVEALAHGSKGAEHFSVENRHPSLPLVLAILSDLLYECADARDVFVKWCSYEVENKEVADDHRVNAVQLLLRLWEEDFSVVTNNVEWPLLTSHDITPVRETSVAQGSNLKKSCDVDGGSMVSRKTSPNSMSFTKPCSILANLRHADETVSGEIDNGKEGPPVDVPLFHANTWGLELLGLRGRACVGAELRRRYAELEKRERSFFDTSVCPFSSSQSWERLSTSICRTLGLRVFVYSCLAAAGFERIASMKLNPMERVKLLHITALPSICKDEVWGAIAESVDMRGRAIVIPVANSGFDDMTDFCGNVLSTPPTTSLISPIEPDLENLVKVLRDVDARSEELYRLTRVSIDTNTAHEVEEAQRCLFSLLRRDKNDPAPWSYLELGCVYSAGSVSSAKSGASFAFGRASFRSERGASVDAKNHLLHESAGGGVAGGVGVQVTTGKGEWKDESTQTPNVSNKVSILKKRKEMQEMIKRSFQYCTPLQPNQLLLSKYNM
uniref:Uncharacterized protein n=1 Tax=Trypanosoma vivax (strain Y486) TaxID=1055687 RepID=G0U5U6_TRYVY|nr:conserved hypothetical protein [Trypanosoma vivax Y486]